MKSKRFLNLRFNFSNFFFINTRLKHSRWEFNPTKDALLWMSEKEEWKVVSKIVKNLLKSNFTLLNRLSQEGGPSRALFLLPNPEERRFQWLSLIR